VQPFTTACLLAKVPLNYHFALNQLSMLASSSIVVGLYVVFDSTVFQFNFNENEKNILPTYLGKRVQTWISKRID